MTQRRGRGVEGCSLARPRGQSRSQTIKGTTGQEIPTHAQIISALSSAGEPEGDPAPQPVQNRCQHATGMGHALTRERLTLPCGIAEEEETPRHSRDANASQTTPSTPGSPRSEETKPGRSRDQRQAQCQGTARSHLLHLPSLQTHIQRDTDLLPHQCRDLPCGSAMPHRWRATLERPPRKLTGGTPDPDSLTPHCCHAPAMLHKHFGERELRGPPLKNTPIWIAFSFQLFKG